MSAICPLIFITVRTGLFSSNSISLMLAGMVRQVTSSAETLFVPRSSTAIISISFVTSRFRPFSNTATRPRLGRLEVKARRENLDRILIHLRKRDFAISIVQAE
jgi:hypothetical protein